jgi:hypothetical protein
MKTHHFGFNATRSLPVFDGLPDGWRVIEGAQTAPLGFRLICNGESLFSGLRKTALIEES